LDQFRPRRQGPESIDCPTAFPWPCSIFANGGYTEEKLTTALAQMGAWVIELVKRSDPSTTSSSCRGAGSSNGLSLAQLAICDLGRDGSNSNPAGPLFAARTSFFEPAFSKLS
jgi:hypothetical protein